MGNSKRLDFGWVWEASWSWPAEMREVLAGEEGLGRQREGKGKGSLAGAHWRGGGGAGEVKGQSEQEGTVIFEKD